MIKCWANIRQHANMLHTSQLLYQLNEIDAVITPILQRRKWELPKVQSLGLRSHCGVCGETRLTLLFSLQAVFNPFVHCKL